MAYTELQIVNMALGKIGGAGDQVTGEAFLANLLGTDKITTYCNTKMPQIRQEVIADLAILRCPFRETLKYADLGDDIKQNDHGIESITVGAGPTYAITVTTDEAHEYTTGDTIMLFDIEGDGGIDSLNKTLYTITVVDTTSFTLDSTTGSADYDHTANSGVSSDCPEIGGYDYAFTLPSDYFCLVYQTDEDFSGNEIDRPVYRCETLLNKDSDGLILVTNDYSNHNGDSAFIHYCIDQSDYLLHNQQFVECEATLLAAELCPIVGRNMDVRQQMLMEYKTITVPDAQAYNQSQANVKKRTIPNFFGGRSSTLRTI